MRHFSCDLCSKDLIPGEDARYVVRIDIAPSADPVELTQPDLDQDHLDAMAEMLDDLEKSPESYDGPAGRTLEYDLCQSCLEKFSSDPLGRERARKPQFSKN
jgi:hypothetical protein